ncbi:MAG: TIGR03960 family B12-binding radical SAM protein [Synergistaceae bacterium]|nr:TIGR03960 family B12-binding radical SAM protein [Synergistaceae bacterium]
MYFDEFDSPEWKILSQVSRPSRYSGSEWRPDNNKLSWDDAKLRVCLAFPDVYEIGMSYYGFQIIESFIHSMNNNYLADRVYSPWPDMEKLMLANNIALTSTEHKKCIKDFDVLAFTLPHEAAYTNILTIINLAGLPIKSSERDNKDFPLVIAGGYGAYVPEVMSEFIDAFCIGEAEALLPELLPVIEATKNFSRDERLRELAKLPGVYVPLCYESGSIITRQISQKLFRLDSMIVPSVNIVHDRAAIELFRGCSRGCRFCQAGMVNRPVRERGINEAHDSILNIIRSTGWEEAGLLSLASCDYSGIAELIDSLSSELNSRHAKLSLPSLRMDGFSVNLAEKLEGLRSKHGSITFAPEAGTQRLRDVINKGINEEMIIACLNEIFSRGWDRVKLYFMMGLPTETQEDLDAIADLSLRTLRLGRAMGRKRLTVSVSVSGFVPKAHTPFQWEKQDSIQELRDKGRYIKSLIHDRALSIAYHEPEQTFLEGVLSRGDKRTCDVILRAWQTGARFDNWTEYFDLSRWLEAFEYCSLDPEDFTRERYESESLAWDFVNVGVSKSFLLRERHKAYKGDLTQDCLSGCAGCGIGCVK